MQVKLKIGTKEKKVRSRTRQTRIWGTRAAADVVNVRVYQGIHFRFADLNARKQGCHVAQWAYAHFLRPLDDDHDDGEDQE